MHWVGTQDLGLVDQEFLDCVSRDVLWISDSDIKIQGGPANGGWSYAFSGIDQNARDRSKTFRTSMNIRKNEVSLHYHPEGNLTGGVIKGISLENPMEHVYYFSKISYKGLKAVLNPDPDFQDYMVMTILMMFNTIALISDEWMDMANLTSSSSGQTIKTMPMKLMQEAINRTVADSMAYKIEELEVLDL